MSADKYVVRKAQEEDVNYLIENIRPEDVEEVDELDGTTIKQTLEETPNLLENSLVWVVDGKLVCMFGVTPLKGHSKTGVIWLLATKEFEKYSWQFAVKCKKVFKEVISEYEYLFNYIYWKNKSSMRWLEWLGFNVHGPKPIGRKGADFHKFELLNV